MDLRERIELADQIGGPQIFEFDLATAITIQEVAAAGDVLLFWHSAGATDEITVRLHRRDAPAIPMLRGDRIETPFSKIFLTVPGTGTGTGYLMFGDSRTLRARKGSDVTGSVSDVVSEVQDVEAQLVLAVAALVAIQAELQGIDTDGTYGTEKTVGTSAVEIIAANTNRKGGIIQAKSTNSGIVYLGFDSTTTSSKWFAELAAGDAWNISDFRGQVYAIASAASQLVGFGQW